MIASINIAVVFHGSGMSTSFCHCAQTSWHTHPSCEGGIKYLYEEITDIATHPFVKNRT